MTTTGPPTTISAGTYGRFVATDLEFEAFAQHVPLQSEAGRRALQEALLHPAVDVAGVRKRQRPLLALRRALRGDQGPPVAEALGRLVEAAGQAEGVVAQCCVATPPEGGVLPPTPPTTAKGGGVGGTLVPPEELAVTTVLWRRDTLLGRALNPRGGLLEGLLAWRTLLVPALALLGPLIAAVALYLSLRATVGAAEAGARFGALLMTTVLQHAAMPPRLQAAPGALGTALRGTYLAASVALFCASLYNTVSSAAHVRGVAHSLRARGEALESLRAAAGAAVTALRGTGQASLCGLAAEGEAALGRGEGLGTGGPLGAYGAAYNDSASASAALLRFAGRVDLLRACSSLRGVCLPAPLKRSNHPSLRLVDAYHPALRGLGRPVLNSLSLGGDVLPLPLPSTAHASRGGKGGSMPPRHALLTGPNRGGKSTLCRAVGMIVVAAQALGIAWARAMEWTPLQRLETALHPADALGRVSLFEAEIDFAKGALATPPGHFSLLIMDEIFHSTNAHDGAAATRVFLRQLHAQPNALSLVSTHYAEVAEWASARSAAQPLHMVARPLRGEARVRYTYRCAPGVSRVSSVQDILRERGLLT